LTPEGRRKLNGLVVEDGWVQVGRCGAPARLARHVLEVGAPLPSPRFSQSDGSLIEADNITEPDSSSHGAAHHRLALHPPVGSTPHCYHLHRSTVSKVLARCNMRSLGNDYLNTGPAVRKLKPVRYEQANLGDLVHVDVKKLGGIPAGGGWRILGENRSSATTGLATDPSCSPTHSVRQCTNSPAPIDHKLTGRLKSFTVPSSSNGPTPTTTAQTRPEPPPTRSGSTAAITDPIPASAANRRSMM